MINQDLITNEDYQDFRELICYERPASILLHFDHGILGLRLFWVDRILLERQDNRIIAQSNKFADFLNMHNVLANVSISTKSLEDFAQDLRSEFENESAHAVLLTYGNHLAGELLLSTWMVEYNKENTADPWLVTSLRGDDFYVRRSMSTEDLYNRSYKSNNISEVQRLSFSEKILSLARLSLNDFIRDFNIDDSILDASQKLSAKRLLGDSAGCEILLNQVLESRPQHSDLVEKVASGFKNVLLVKYFWPIQFHFKPFLVFVKQYLKVKNIQDDFISEEIDSIRIETEILNGLANKYGLNPQSKYLDQFNDYFLSILQRTQAIENYFFENYPHKKTVYKIESSGPLTCALSSALNCSNIHLVSKSAMAPILHLSDKTAMEDPQSGYIDKSSVRARLSKTPFAVAHTTISSAADLLNLSYPLILKSSLGWGSGYVFKVNTKFEAQESLAQIKNLHRLLYSGSTEPKIMAEEFLTGQEFAAEIKITSEGPQILCIFERLEKEKNELLDHAYVLILSHQQVLKSRFSHLLTQICEEVQITSPFVHIEFKWNEENRRLGLIEINFRLGGGGFLAGVAHLASGVNIFNTEPTFEISKKQSTEDIFLGLVPKVAGKGLVIKIKGKEQVMAMKGTKKAFWLKNEGSYFAPPPLGFDYPAGVISSHKDLQEMNQYISEVEKVLEFIYA